MIKRLILVMFVVPLFEGVQAQKGEKSISAGPLISFPLSTSMYQNHLKIGAGLELTGQYNTSNKSALLLQISFTSFGVKQQAPYFFTNSIRIISVKGGY